MATLVVFKFPTAEGADTMLSTLEGAIVLARARRDLGPLDAAAAELAPLLDAAARPRRRRNRTDHQAGNITGPEEGEGH